MGTDGVKSAYMTGQGRFVVRGVATIEDSDSGNRGDRIIVTEACPTRSTRRSGLKALQRWSRRNALMV